MKEGMDKYIVDCMDEDGEIITMIIEARVVVETQYELRFFDEHGEDECVFDIKNIVNYKRIK
jgi:hypothetical protein